MNRIIEPIRQLFTPAPAVPAGIYHYQSAAEDEGQNFRLHLRVEPDGTGVLIVNAATVLHLNETAAQYAYYLVQRVPADETAQKMSKRYRVDFSTARKDFVSLRERIETLLHMPDLDPVTFLDFERREPFAGQLSAPYRLDCALTYKMTEGSNPEAAPIKRVDRELTAEEWKVILDKAWAAGIPHVVFTGGEPTMRPDLPELISYAEANGQVSGLLSDGLRLVDSDYFNSLLQTGLDHLTLILQADNPLSWQAIEAALPADIFLVVHLTLTPMNISTAAGWLDRLAELGVKTISLSTSTVDLGDALAALRDQAAARQLELVWNLPVPYSILNPVRLEIEPVERLPGAGRAWLYVEPDGDVLPAQDINQVLGNFLRDPWGKIWQGQPG